MRAIFRARASLAALLCIILLPASLGAAEPAAIRDSYLILEDGVIDLRANPQIRRSLGGGVGGWSSMEDLKVGSIFIGADNVARKVVALREKGGEVIVETVIPKLQEVVAEFEMPEQEIAFTTANILPGSLTEGVSLVPEAAPLANLPMGPLWIDTDTDVDIQNARVFNVSLNKTLFKTEGSAESGGDDDGPANGGTAGGNAAVSVEGSAELRIEGNLRIADPILRGGIRMPSMKIRWVKVWFCIGYPEITFTRGWIQASFEAAQQIDAKLIGAAEAALEIKIPLYAIAATDPSGTVSAIIGVYLKLTIEGKLEVVFEVNEYSRFGAWGSVDLVWPFIPVDVSAGSSFYAGFALRPSISAEVEAKLGPYLGFEASLLGIDVLSLEAGGGVYANASGFIEAMDVVGWASGYGGYGSWSDWYYRVKAEMGGYVEANMTIISYDINLFEKRWPFLSLDNQGEL